MITTYENIIAKSGIHINPANKGKFNATKKKTGKTTEELTHSSNPVTKKRAIFAQNASHWNHKKAEDGTELTPLNTNKPNSLLWKMPESPTNPLYNIPDQGDFQADGKPFFRIPKENQGGEAPDLTYNNPSAPDAPKEPHKWGEYITAGLSLTDALIPKQREPYPVQKPLQSYNPYQYGTGSSALMKDGGKVDKYGDGGDDGKKKKIPNAEKARQVNAVPGNEYTPLGTENGNDYYLHSSKPTLKPAVPGSKGGDPKKYNQFLQQQLQSGVTVDDLVNGKYISKDEAPKYQQYYKAAPDDMVYINHPSQPATIPTPAVADSPQAGFDGQIEYNNAGATIGRFKYPIRNSSGQSDPGIINGAQQPVQFMFTKKDVQGAPVDSTKGKYNIPVGDWSKMTHGTNTLQDTTGMYKFKQPLLEMGGALPGATGSMYGHTGPLKKKMKMDDGGDIQPISYEEGGTYDLSPEEVENLKKKGYKLKIH